MVATSSLVASNMDVCGSHEYPVKPEMFPQRYIISDPIELDYRVPEKYHTACQTAEEKMTRLDALRNTANGEAARDFDAEQDWKAAKTAFNNAKQQLKVKQREAAQGKDGELHPDLAWFETPTSFDALLLDDVQMAIV